MLLKREAKHGSSECLSGDEGYFGSYSDSHVTEIKKNAHSSRPLLKCADNDEPILLRIFEDYIEEPLQTLLHDHALQGQLCLFESIETFIEPILIELSLISEQRAAQSAEEQRAAEKEMREDWRRCLERVSAQEKAQQERGQEDALDLSAYLQEIDMNVAYFQSELGDPSEPSLLRFASNLIAFNLRVHHRLLDQRNAFRTLFANVDAIPEFVPALQESDDVVDEYETTYIDEGGYPMDDGECLYPDHEFTMVETDEGFREELGQHEMMSDELDYYDKDLDEFEDQLLIDSLGEEEKLALLQSESEKFALQMAQASKYGICNPGLEIKAGIKSRRYNSGASSSPSEHAADAFEGVFAYEEFDEVSSTTSPQVEADKNGSSLRTSLLKLMQTRRNLAELIERNASTCSSQASSLTTASSLSKQMASRKPCVYMLNEGRCMRADCRFAHDLKTITCKYWQDGDCLKGDNCEFLHGVVESKSLGKSSKKKCEKTGKKDFKLDTEEFPELGGGAKGNQKTQAATKSLKQGPTKSTASTLFSNLASNKNNKVSNGAKTPAVNIVSNNNNNNNKQQSKSKKNAQKEKQAAPAKTVKQTATGRKSRDPHAKTTKPSTQKSNNSCGSSSSSSACSSSSRCNSIIRKK